MGLSLLCNYNCIIKILVLLGESGTIMSRNYDGHNCKCEHHNCDLHKSKSCTIVQDLQIVQELWTQRFNFLYGASVLDWDLIVPTHICSRYYRSLKPPNLLDYDETQPALLPVHHADSGGHRCLRCPPHVPKHRELHAASQWGFAKDDIGWTVA